MSTRDNGEVHYNYLFVSDFHMSLGKDALKKSINMREDFFFDEEFFRFLRWADKNRVGKTEKDEGEPWELVFVGDCFDFLPVDKYVSATLHYFKKELLRIHTMDTKNKNKLLEDFFRTDIPHALQKQLLEPYIRGGIISRNDLAPINGRRKWIKDIFGELDSEGLEERPKRVGLMIEELLNQEPIKRARQQINQYGAKAQQQINQQWESALGQEKHDLFTEELAVGKLGIIYNGHPTFFEALSWWVSRGNKIVVMVGNHDLELRWDGVQEEFKEILNKIHEENHQEVKWKDTGKILPFDRSLIKFNHFWFYFKPGVFYAQHGSQFDKITSVVNLINPFWEEGGEKLLYASFGSYGDGLVSELEDYFPEWDNAKTHGPTLINKIKEYPYRVFQILLKNIASQIWYILKLFIGTRGIKAPSDDDLQQYLDETGLGSNQKSFKFPLKLAREIYDSWDKPFFHHQRSSWLFYVILTIILALMIPLVLLSLVFIIALWLYRTFFSWKGVLVAVLILFTLFPQAAENLVQFITNFVRDFFDWTYENLGTHSQRMRLIENINMFIQVNFKPYIQIGGILGAAYVLGKIYLKIKNKIYKTCTSKNKKFFQLFTWGEEKYIQEAGKEIYQLFKLSVLKHKELREEDMPRSFIFGHDHFPFSYVLNKSDGLNNLGEIFYFNTGAWQSWFAREGHRRLRTGGSDLEFTFLRIWKPEGARDYEVDLLRWNDDANRAAEQIVFERKEESGLIDKLYKMLGEWVPLFAGFGAVLGLLIGYFMNYWFVGCITGAVSGTIVGLGFNQWAKKIPQY